MGGPVSLVVGQDEGPGWMSRRGGVEEEEEEEGGGGEPYSVVRRIAVR